jgi:flagellar basal-body rod protein FlgB
LSLVDATQLSLQSAMRGSMLQQTLLTNNLANADTPGYQAESVDFQGVLQQALATGQSPADVTFTPETVGGAVGADGNTVSEEQTSAEISENGLLYQDLTAVAAQRDQIMSTAIGTPAA